MKRITFLLSILLSAGAFAADYDIRDYGAKEGAMNTVAIQKAVDACSADGGGRVVVPRGTWTSGTVDLKDGVILFLEKGAMIKGSERIEDYNPQNLIRAKKVSGAGIDGYGTIDGSGSAFWHVEGVKYMHNPQKAGMMVIFQDCKDMILRGVRLQNAESWTVHILACTGVKVTGLTIRNPLHGPNNDGIDIQASKDVVISDCDIYTSDDAICIKNRDGRYYDRACANVTVSNCILTTVCNALKIGTETRGQIRNIVFTGCTVRQAQPGDPGTDYRSKTMNMTMRSISGISVESVDGALVDGVVVSNIAMEKVRCPIFIRLGARMAGAQRDPNPVPGSIRNVSISNVTCRESIIPSIIAGIPGYAPQNITISNYTSTTAGSQDDTLPGKTVEEKIADYPDAHMWGDMPASGFYIRHAKDVTMSGINCSLTGPDLRPAFILEDVDGMVLDGLVTDRAMCGDAAMRLIRVRDGRFSGMRLRGQTAFDWDMRGELNEEIHLSDANPAKVRSEKSCAVVQQTSFILK